MIGELLPENVEQALDAYIKKRLPRDPYVIMSLTWKCKEVRGFFPECWPNHRVAKSLALYVKKRHNHFDVVYHKKAARYDISLKTKKTD